MADITANITIRGADNLPMRFTPLSLTLTEAGADLTAQVEIESVFAADADSFILSFGDKTYSPERTRTLGAFTYNDAGTVITGERGAFQITDTSIERAPDSTVIKGELIPDKTTFVDLALDALEARYAVRFTDGQRTLYPIQGRWDNILKPMNAIADAPGFWRYAHDQILEGSKPNYARLVRTLSDYGLRIWRLDGNEPIRIYATDESADSVLLAPAPINRMAARRFVSQSELADYGLRLAPNPTGLIRLARTRVGATVYGFKAVSTLGNDPDPWLTLDAGFDAHGLTVIPVADIVGFDHAGYTFWLVPSDHAAGTVSLDSSDLGTGTFSEQYVNAADRRLDRRIGFSVPINEAFDDDVDRYIAPLAADAARARTAADTARTNGAANADALAQAATDAEARAQPENIPYIGGARTPGLTLAEAKPDPYLGVIALESERVRRYWRNHAAKAKVYVNPHMRDGASIAMPSVVGGGVFFADAVTTVIDPSGEYSQSLTLRGVGLPATPERLAAQSPAPFNGEDYPAYWTPPEQPSVDFLTLDEAGTGAAIYDPGIDAMGVVTNPYPLGGGFVLETATRTIGTGDERRQASPIIERTNISVARVVSAADSDTGEAYSETAFAVDNEGWSRLINFADGLAGENYRVSVSFANRWGVSATRELPITLSASERPTVSVDAMMPKIQFDQENSIPDSRYLAYASAMAGFQRDAVPVSAQGIIIGSRLTQGLGRVLVGADISDISRNLARFIVKSWTIQNWGFETRISSYVNNGVRYFTRNFILQLGAGRQYSVFFGFRGSSVDVIFAKFTGGALQPAFRFRLPVRITQLISRLGAGAGAGVGALRILTAVSRIAKFAGPIGNALSALGQVAIFLSDAIPHGAVLVGTADGKGRVIERVRVQHQRYFVYLEGESGTNEWESSWSGTGSGIFSNGAGLAVSPENNLATRSNVFQYAPFARNEITLARQLADGVPQTVGYYSHIRFRLAAITELNRAIAHDDAALEAAGDWIYTDGVRYEDYVFLWVNPVTAAVEKTPSVREIDPDTGAAIMPPGEGGGG